jgi:hypothetical protein
VIPSGDGALLTRAPAVVDALVAEALVLYNPVSGRYACLNATGALIWSQLARPRRVCDLAAALASRYAVDPARAATDVRRLAAALSERGLVEIVPAEPAPPAPGPPAPEPDAGSRAKRDA